MTGFALVDSPAALGQALAGGGIDRILTDNPFLEATAGPQPVRNAERCLTTDAVAALGSAALELANAVDGVLEGSDLAQRLGVPPFCLRIAGTSSRLIASLLHRAAALSAALAEVAPGPVHVFCADVPDWDPALPCVLSRFASPAPLLAAAGFFGDRDVSVTRVPTPIPETVNDTAIRALAPRLAMVPAAMIAYEAAQRLPGAVRLLGRRRPIGIAGSNEAIREALPHLLARGLRPLSLGSLTGGAADLPLRQERAGLDGPAQHRLDGLVGAAVAATGRFNGRQAAAVAAVLGQGIARAVALLAAGAPAVERRAAAVTATLGPGGVVMTNGLFGPLGGIAYAHLRRQGLTIVDLEHGVTTGLAALSAARIDCSEAARCDALLVSSDRAARRFHQTRREGTVTVATVGLPDQTRRLLRPGLQRRLARRRLGIAPGDSLVMHVSTLLYHGNARPGGGAPAEWLIHDTDLTLIGDVYARIRHRVAFKPYPTRRFAYQPDYADCMPRPANLLFLGDQDFRYIRAAADVIVTSTPTSTLGWCVGTGRPLVYLDSRIVNPLEDEALRQRFAAAFLVVDLDRPDWPSALAQLLDRPLGAIEDDWQARAAARRTLLADAIGGPPGVTGRRIADAVAGCAPTPGAAGTPGRAGPDR